MKETARQPRTRTAAAPAAVTTAEEERSEEKEERPGCWVGRKDERHEGLRRRAPCALGVNSAARPPEEPRRQPARLAGRRRLAALLRSVRTYGRNAPGAHPRSLGSMRPSVRPSVRHDPLSRLNEAERFVSVCTLALVLLFVHSPSAIVPGQFRFQQKS